MKSQKTADRLALIAKRRGKTVKEVEQVLVEQIDRAYWQVTREVEGSAPDKAEKEAARSRAQILAELEVLGKAIAALRMEAVGRLDRAQAVLFAAMNKLGGDKAYPAVPTTNEVIAAGGFTTPAGHHRAHAEYVEKTYDDPRYAQILKTCRDASRVPTKEECRIMRDIREEAEAKARRQA